MEQLQQQLLVILAVARLNPSGESLEQLIDRLMYDIADYYGTVIS